MTPPISYLADGGVPVFPCSSPPDEDHTLRRNPCKTTALYRKTPPKILMSLRLLTRAWLMPLSSKEPRRWNTSAPVATLQGTPDVPKHGNDLGAPAASSVNRRCLRPRTIVSCPVGNTSTPGTPPCCPEGVSLNPPMCFGRDRWDGQGPPASVNASCDRVYIQGSAATGLVMRDRLDCGERRSGRKLLSGREMTVHSGVNSPAGKRRLRLDGGT